MYIQSICTLQDTNNISEWIIIKQQTSLTPIRIIGRNNLSHINASGFYIIDQLFIRHQVKSFPLFILQTDLYSPFFKRSRNLPYFRISKKIEPGTQHLDIQCPGFNDKRLFRILFHLKITFTWQINFTSVSHKYRRVYQYTTGIQPNPATIRQNNLLTLSRRNKMFYQRNSRQHIFHTGCLPIKINGCGKHNQW